MVQIVLCHSDVVNVVVNEYVNDRQISVKTLKKIEILIISDEYRCMNFAKCKNSKDDEIFFRKCTGY